MTTAIIAAMDKEVKLLLERLEDAETGKVCGLDYALGKLGGKDVVIMKSGIGKAAAASATAVAIARFNAGAVINTGVCAGMYKIGTVVLAERCVQHDFDMTADGQTLGKSSDFDSPFFYSDKHMTWQLGAALQRCGAKYEICTIASGDVFLEDKKRMTAIGFTFCAHALEMESGAVAQVCTRAGVPFAVIRAVSDGGDSHEDYVKFADKVCDTFTNALETYFRDIL